MRPRCSRTWAVEAARDGRLTGAEQVEIARHLTECAACTAQAAWLDRLGRGLRSLPFTEMNQLAVRRQRGQLLSAFNDWLLGRSPRPRPSTLVAIAGVLLLVCGVGVRLASHRWLASQLGRELPVVEVQGAPGARWLARPGEVYRVEILDGEVDLQIHRTPSMGRVVLAVPDGEIEDLGTALSVVVQRAETTMVSVLKGEVELRLAGRPPIHLRAGETWHPTTLHEPTDGLVSHFQYAEAEAVPETPRSQSSTPSRVHHKPHPVDSSRTSTHPRGPVGSDVTEASNEDVLKADIARTLAEDAAYLALMELIDAGKMAQARAAAREYLQRFPNGLRRIEVWNIAASEVDP